MTKVQNEWMLSFRKFLKQHRLHANDAHGSKLARYTVRCSTNHIATIVNFFFKNKKKKENKIKSDRFIKDVCHCRFDPASHLRSGANWGLCLTGLLPSCYKKHTHTTILLDKNSHPFPKKRKKTNPRDKSHHTLYGHTTERTTIQIFMKSFPSGNI